MLKEQIWNQNWIMYLIFNFLRKCNVEFVLKRCVLIFNAVENGLAETYMHPQGSLYKGIGIHVWFLASIA